MKITVALVGNPNSGKTTLFNGLTGNNQYVGNWPGVTIEKKEGKYRKDKDVSIMDLPGVYSLSPYTLEEVVTRNYLLDEKPDVIINIIDGSNLERNLYLTTQILELSIPVVVAINMMDIVEKRGDKIDVDQLEKILHCKVTTITAINKEGFDNLIKEVVNRFENKNITEPLHVFEGPTEHAIAHIEEAVGNAVDKKEQRWYAIKLFERDVTAINKIDLDKETKKNIEENIKLAETELDDDAESIITNDRYEYISKIIKRVSKKKHENLDTTSDKIDRIVTNRWLGLPIFVLVIGFVYWISITTVGAFATEWTNDILFGEIIIPWVANVMIGSPTWLSGLIVDGIVSGVGSVLGFVPQILILYILLAILEQCGYMARIAFVLDRVFRKFGLSGKSFIPMLIGTGCSVPGIMASRTIEDPRNRRMTIMTTSFMPCSAKLPIIALISGALFNNSGWIATSAYFLGIFSIVISGIILKKTKPFAGEPSPFVMELPSYHIPTIVSVLRATWERGWSFIKKAGTIIALATVVIWFVGSYSFSLQAVDNYQGSILQVFGGHIAFIFAPLGFGNDWASVATILGLVAKETVIATFGILSGMGSEVTEESMSLLGWVSLNMTAISGYSFLMFNLLCAPCFAAIGAIKREMNNTRWTLYTIVYQTVFAYSASLIFYQYALMFTGNINIIGFVFATIILFIVIYLIFRKEPKSYLETNTLQINAKTI